MYKLYLLNKHRNILYPDYRRIYMDNCAMFIQSSNNHLLRLKAEFYRGKFNFIVEYRLEEMGKLRGQW